MSVTPSQPNIIYYNGQGSKAKFFLKNAPNTDKVIPWQEPPTAPTGITVGKYRFVELQSPSSTQAAEGQWVAIDDIAQKIVGGDTAIADSFKQITPAQFSSATCTRTAPVADPHTIDVNENRICIRGDWYKFSYQSSGMNLPLTHMTPSKKEEFMRAVQEAAEATTEGLFSDQIKNIILSFTGGKFNKATVKNEANQEVTSLEAADKKFEKYREPLSNWALTANSGLLAIHRHATAINGIKRHDQAATCWLGTAMHLFANTYGHLLEGLDPATPGRDLLIRIRDILFKDQAGTVTQHDIDELIALGVPANFQDPKGPNDPIEYVQFLQNRLFPGPTHIFDCAPKRFQADFPRPAQYLDEMIVNIQRATPSGGIDNTSCPIALNLGEHELTSVAVYEKGHYITYCYRDDAWWKCDDENVTRVATSADEKAMQALFSTNATQLVYRKVATPMKPEFKASLRALHSKSFLDNDKWITRTLLFDKAKKILGNRGTLLQHSSGRAFRCGVINDRAELVATIGASTQPDPLVIPMIKNNRHWVCIIVNRTNRTIEYFDSCGRVPSQDIEDLSRQLGYPITCVLNEQNKWQDDGFRCGDYLIYFLLKYGHLPDFFSPSISRSVIDGCRLGLRREYNRHRPNCGFTLPQP